MVSVNVLMRVSHNQAETPAWVYYRNAVTDEAVLVRNKGETMRRSVRILLSNYEVAKEKASSLSLQEMYAIADQEENGVLNKDSDAFWEMVEKDVDMMSALNNMDGLSDKHLALEAEKDLSNWIKLLVA